MPYLAGKAESMLGTDKAITWQWSKIMQDIQGGMQSRVKLGTQWLGRVTEDRIWSKLGPRSLKSYSWGRACKGRFHSFNVKIWNLSSTSNVDHKGLAFWFSCKTLNPCLLISFAFLPSCPA